MAPRDRNHAACAKLLRTARELLLPAPVLVELDYFLTELTGSHRPFDEVLRRIENGVFTILDLATDDYPRVRELRAQYGDWPLGFVDAAVVAMAEKAFVGQARCGFLLVSGHARVAGFCVLVATRSGHLSYTPESSVVAGSELVGEPPCECRDVLQGLFIKSSARTCQDRRSQLIKRSATRRHPT